MHLPGGRAHLGDLAQDDEVVAGVVLGPDLAVEPHGGVLQHWGARPGRALSDVRPLVGALAGELVRDPLLVVREDVDRQPPGPPDPGIGGGGLHDAEGDQRRGGGDAVGRTGR